MNEQKYALIVLCKCGECHKSYGIRAEKVGTKEWMFTWAFPIKDSSAKREGYDRTNIEGTIHFSSEYPGCPHCGRRELTVCCSCGHLNCTIENDSSFTCEWCGNQGILGNYTGEKITAGIDL